MKEISYFQCFIVDWVQCLLLDASLLFGVFGLVREEVGLDIGVRVAIACLLYTSPSPRDATLSRMPSSA